jgi:hypothetical protein
VSIKISGVSGVSYRKHFNRYNQNLPELNERKIKRVLSAVKTRKTAFKWVVTGVLLKKKPCLKRRV